MLEKILGMIIAKKMCGILLLEADFNSYNRMLLAKQMIDRATENDWIPQELCATKGSEAVEVTLNRLLVSDLSGLWRILLAMASVHANTCYDRAAHSMASIAAQRWHVERQAIGVMLMMIQLMLVFICTGFGDSISFGRSGTPLQGFCQGNKGGPAMWLCISAALVNMMHEQGHMTQIQMAISAALLTIMGFLFVDDMDLVILAESARVPVRAIVATTQARVKAWQGRLRATGSTLRPDKYFWVLVDYSWRDGKWRYSDSPVTLYVNDLDGQQTVVTRHPASKVIKVVGVHQALDRNMTEQVKVLKEKARDWGKKIRAGFTPRHLAHQAVHLMVWASIKYPLPVTTMTHQQGSDISSILFMTVLPKLGAIRSFPKVYCYAPTELQGLALPHATVEQEIDHIRKILTHGAIDTPTGILLKATLEQAQLEVGSRQPFLNLPFKTHCTLLTPCFWKGVWEFTCEHDIRLQWAGQAIPLAQREDDRFIMEELMDAGVKGVELISCNRVRLSMEALTLADITTADGTMIHADARMGHQLAPSKWIRAVERPSATDISRWQACLQYILSSTYMYPIWNHLGRWLPDPHTVWPWHYSPSTHHLYTLQQGNWHEYARQGCTRCSTFSRIAIGVTAPPDLCRAEVSMDPWDNPCLVNFTTQVERPVQSFDSIQDLISSWQHHWPLADSHFPLDPGPLIMAIQNGTAMGCCNGSYQPYLSTNIGAAAWKVEDPLTKSAIGSLVPCSGMEKEVRSYQAELQGCHTLLLGIKAFCTFYNIQQGKV